MIKKLLKGFLLCTITLCSAIDVDAQTIKNVAFKFNFGTSFSKPKDDLAVGYRAGKEMQLFGALEAAKHINYGKTNGIGMKLALVAGYDYSNILRDDALTQLKVGIPNIKGRIYPLSFVGKQDDLSEIIGEMAMKMPMGINILASWVLWGSFNGLHFDYGAGFAKITETPYLDEFAFPEQSISRTMRYFGWGFQPQILQSSSQKWTMNAVFDFGKYKWANNSGGTSSIKYSYVGFGVQYHIK